MTEILKSAINSRIDQIKDLRIHAFNTSLDTRVRLESWNRIYDLCMLLIEENVIWGTGKGSMWASELLERARVQIDHLNAREECERASALSDEQIDDLKNVIRDLVT